MNTKETENLKLLAITGCATGIAHTFMAAEGIERGAKNLKIKVKVETHGTTGPENVFTAKEIREADLILVSADINVNLDRFVGKKVYVTNTKLAISNPETLIKNAIEGATVYKVKIKHGKNSETKVKAINKGQKESKFVKHLMYAIG